MNAANIPPGPDTMADLRERVPPHVLARLPTLDAMKFEDHEFDRIGIENVKLRLHVGSYEDRIPS